MKKWKCCLTAIVIAAGSMLVGCQESSSAKPIEAMYIPAGEDGHLMVGEGTGNVFTVTMPDNIQDKNGKKISEEDLNRGDIVAIYGDEIMLESYPGQYPGVTKIKVVKEGKASDADQYQDILDEFWPEKDPGELPYLNIGYCASYGEVSAAATRGGYSWSYADKDGVEQNKTADSAAVTQWPDLPVMNVDGTTDMELKLTKEQEEARELIIQKVSEALEKEETKQLIFIDGEAGTGKTVLTSSTFYELYCQAEESNKELKCQLLVNHDEQIIVYEQIAEKLGLTEKYGKVVSKPTTFINNHSENDPIDVAFVDEAHLLLTQGKQSYRGENQLRDIIDRARVTVVMFDENQILTTEQFWESQILEKYRNQAKAENNHIALYKQLRMQVDFATMDWIDSFTKERCLKKIPDTFGGYDIKVFDKPELLDVEIQKKAKESDSMLSRVIATYDWEYSSNHRPEDRLMRYWEVLIGKWHKPWNRELESELTRKEKRAIKGLAWAEQPQTINEVGSTFTIQGFDLNYAGVILGPSVKYRNGKVIFDPLESCNEKAIRNRTLSDGTKQKFGEILIQHEVRVLMTRGVNGMYIYACDPELQKALLEAAK